MRPVRLTMQAFGPYAGREVIDFRDAVEAGLFGIYGQTGSGKSTIFSGMTFALFGEPARKGQEAPSLRSDHADPGMPTEVEFVFDVGEKRYLIIRRPEQKRPKQRGDGETLDKHEAWLFDATGIALDKIASAQPGRVIAEKKVNAVTAAVADILGYGPEQFRQIVLLPQGQFEAFLIAPTKDRLTILRKLFDVSLYRDLAVKVKTDAEAAERKVRNEREVCSQRLAAEGFESTDALTARISSISDEHGELLLQEEVCRSAVKTTQVALQGAQDIERRFMAADEAQQTLADLQSRAPEMAALTAKIRDAEKARGLLDVEAQVTSAAGEVNDAAEAHKEKQSRFEVAADKARQAAEIDETEKARSAEIDALRSEIEALRRHKDTITKSADIKAGCDDAAKKAKIAEKALGAAKQKLAELTEERRKQMDVLTTERRKQEQLHGIRTHLATLDMAHQNAVTYENAERALAETARKVSDLTSKHGLVTKSGLQARLAFEAAELRLAQVQAFHLAAKLRPGDPCPVCGATDHPLPATGQIQHVGLDQAFRDAKASWEKAQAVEREAERLLTAEQGVLQERRSQAEALQRPERNSAALRTEIEGRQKILDEFGPERDIPAMESTLAQMEQNIAEAEGERDSCQEASSCAITDEVAARARLDELLSAIPETLRDSESLVKAIIRKEEAVATRKTALDSAAEAATVTREAALSAQKELEATEQTLFDWQQPLDKAQQAFAERLRETGLTEDTFNSLKPAIDKVMSDRKVVEEYNTKLRTTQEENQKATQAVEGMDRPDLQSFADALRRVEDQLTAAMEARAKTGAQLEHLRKLHNDLAESLRRLDEMETTTGPMRNLAALFDAKNPLNLDLETFAIGAMFDQVLDAANLRLSPMSIGRYSFERETEGAGRGRRGLGILVFDIYTGKARPTSTLSGGETFIAALALALGLADVIESASGKVRLDTIFIDEGFGSLDTENGTGTLDQVLQVLSSLVSQNRAVGLISHVPLVQEAIPNGFYVRKDVVGSRIEVRGFV